MLYANYHTHTYRCGHASAVPDEEYIKTAIDEGYQVLGFADHCPWPFKNGFVSENVRMRMEELNEYLDSVHELKEKYKARIKIYTGLECEYYEEYRDALDLMGKKCDYLLLGSHWIRSEEYGHKSTSSVTEPEVINECADNLIRGMESGLFAYVNHPCHMLSSYPEFDEACERMSNRVCETAKRLDLPLEYNMGGMRKRLKNGFSGLGYPCEQFWKIAARTGCNAIIGVDAHAPEELRDRKLIEEAEGDLKSLGIQVIRTLPGLE